jgi:hypothetical protein
LNQVENVTNPATPEPSQAMVNEHLKGMKGREWQNFQRIIREYNKGKISRQQAAQMLKSAYGLGEEELATWLGSDEFSSDIDSIIAIFNEYGTYADNFSVLATRSVFGSDKVEENESQFFAEVVDDTLDKKILNVIDKNKGILAKDIAKAIAQYNGDVELTGRPLPPLPKSTWFNGDPTTEAVSAVRSFARELELIKAAHDPGWNRKVEQGKLNVQQYITGADLEECFDEWDMGREDATDIECVVVLDTSSSMGGQARGAFESMWATKRALDKIGASTTVLTFDAKSHTLYSSDEKATNKLRTIYLGGSTEPLPALKQAKSILANSTRAVKIMFVITDGQWYDSKVSDNIIKELRNAGVITALAYVYDQYDWHTEEEKKLRAPKEIDSHGCEVAMAVSDSTQLYHIARAMVDAGIKRNLSA